MVNKLKRKAIKLASNDSKYDRIVEILSDEDAFIKMIKYIEIPKNWNDKNHNYLCF